MQAAPSVCVLNQVDGQWGRAEGEGGKQRMVFVRAIGRMDSGGELRVRGAGSLMRV